MCVGMQSGSKADKNLRFLLQKVLKQSDVGSLGRIVLPKVRPPSIYRRIPHLHIQNLSYTDCCMHASALHMCSTQVKFAMINWRATGFFSCAKNCLPFSWTTSEGSGDSPAGAEDEGWHLHPDGGHRHIAGLEHAVQVS